MANIKKSERGLKVVPRRLRKIGNSLNLTLPPDFVKANNLKDKQDVAVVWSGRTITFVIQNES